ncbi:MAG: hypothetical protein D6706_17800 [Chloroflexi bacterium]|nr:MAG: hypothetical protein D6706_17800 [Chloroflexota bacterium]
MQKWQGRLRHLVVFLGVVLLVVAVWPPVLSLYELTGEETVAGQVRGVVHWLNTAVRPQPYLAPNVPVSIPVEYPFGMNTFLQQEVEPEKRARSLQLLQQSGFRFIRQEFTWEDIEIHAKGDFVDRRNDPNGIDAWAKYDNIVSLAEQYEIEIIARLSNPPSWSRALPDEEIGSHGPPDNFDDYGDFVATVAERYRGRIRYYQLWNEPNIYPEWGEQNVDPEAYTDLLCTGYRRIKAVDPDAVVIAGALSPTVAVDGRNLNDLIFLERMYAAGAGECFDILSAQGYGLWSGALDRRLRPTVINYPHHLLLRDVMVRHGDASKPLWISEMGWNSVPESLPANYGRVNEEQKARYAVEAFDRARREWPWVGVVNYWFFKRPADWEKDQSWYYFRAMEPDFTPLPVFTAMAAYASNPPDVSLRPNWLYVWDTLRPFFFLVGSAITLLALLNILTKPSDLET